MQTIGATSQKAPRGDIVVSIVQGLTVADIERDYRRMRLAQRLAHSRNN